MESCCVIHVPVGAHVTARVEDWRPVERMDFTVQLHPPKLRLFKLLGQGSAVQVVAGPSLTASLFGLASKSTTSTTTVKAPSFKRFTGQLRRHACWTGAYPR